MLIIDNHDSYTHNIAQLVALLTGVEPVVMPVDRFDLSQESSYAAVIVSPGPGHPLTEPAFHVCLELFRRRTGPTLGVCLGHQGLVVAHGGVVSPSAPAHGVLESLVHDDSVLFAGVPQYSRAVRYHSLAASRVPAVLNVTATGSGGIVMAVAHRELPHFGVQFHPESVLTDAGTRILQNFLEASGIHLALSSPPPNATATEKARLVRPAMSVVASTAPWVEPAVVASHLLRGRGRAFWLDSADRREWTGRWSVMGYLEDDESSVVVGSELDSTASAAAVRRPDFLQHLSDISAVIPEAAGAPPATTGWVGFAGYDTQEIISSKGSGTPSDGFFMRVNRSVAFDHDERVVRCSAATWEQVAELRALVEIARANSTGSHSIRGGALEPISDAPTDQYERAFTRVARALADGDSYEAVLTFPSDFTFDGDPLDQYFALRDRSPAPYAAFLRHGDHFILSASPELMLRVSDGGQAEVRPIKGTLPRLEDAEADAIARWRLGTEDKFRRENLMIVDLIRNDLGRVCVAGSVRVRQLMAVESYSRVHQLVSSIVGTLKPRVSPIECLRAVFPAGSMTGAPKRRTMELIREIEWADRGAYAGALGWFNGSQVEFSVVIRALQGKGDRVTLNVGGGIIVGSTLASEWDEAIDKARSVTVDALLPPGGTRPFSSPGLTETPTVTTGPLMHR